MLEDGNSITFEKTGCIAVVKINNPPQNFLESPVFISKESIRALAEDENIKGLVISGEGRHFSAGANLDSLFNMAKDVNVLRDKMSSGALLLEYISELKIPVVAAINGVCWGGGLEIAMSCHIRFASPKSLFAFPEINANLMPGLGGIARLVKQSGQFNAVAMLLSGDVFNAEEALKYNIVHQIADENVLDFSVKYLERLIGSKPKKVIVTIMQAIHNAYKLPLHEALHEETRMFCDLALAEGLRRKSELK